MYKELLELLFDTELKPNAKGEASVNCPFHDDEHASASVNVKTGLFHCFACGASYNLPQLMVELKPNMFPNINAAKLYLIKQYGSNDELIKYINKVNQYFHYLISHQSLLNTFMKERSISFEVIKRHSIGYNPKNERFVIPIFNNIGKLRAIKYYNHSKTPKLYYEKSPILDNSIYLYPIKNLVSDKSEVFLVEGELDALALESLGFQAVSFTGGAGSFDESLAEFFRDKNVIIFYDNDDAGLKGSARVAEKLKDYVASLRIFDWATISEAENKDDVTDLINKGLLNAEKLSNLISLLPYVVENTEKINFTEVYSTKNLGKTFNLETLLIGKNITPYSFYRRAKIYCTRTRKDTSACSKCPLQKTQIELNFEPKDIFKFIENNSNYIKSMLLKENAVPNCPYAKIDFSEQEFVTKAMGTEAPNFRETKVVSAAKEFYIISNKEFGVNTTYIFKGQIVPDSKNQKNRIVLFDLVESSPDFLNYMFVEDSLERLALFQPNDTTPEAVWEKLNFITSLLSKVTRIFGRDDMLLFYYLIWNSVLSFNCFNEEIKRGWLQGLLVGDQRTGKSKAAQALIKYFGLGDFISAESASVVGLIGGLSKIDNTWTLRWGKLPQNDKRLLIIDEASELSPEAIGKLSEIRSEGVAQITKIEKEMAPARTRLIMISNPRFARPVDSYLFPIDVIKEVIQKPEDIARFDLAYSVSSNDVDQSLINTYHEDDSELVNQYRKAFMESIIWTWSKKPTEVEITKDAQDLMLKYAEQLGNFYDPYYVPLIQSSNIRVKLARISVAVAASVNSSDSYFSKLIVRPEHVIVASQIIERFSKKIGYYQYSLLVHNRQKRIEKIKDKVLERLRQYRSLALYIYETPAFFFKELKDNLGYSELEIAGVKRMLIEYHLVRRNSNGSFSKTIELMKILSILLSEEEDEL